MGITFSPVYYSPALRGGFVCVRTNAANVFSNPLADPSILGISSGASLGVALVMLAGGGTIVTGAFTLSGFLSVIVGAFAGASVVMGLILFLSTLIRNSVYAAHRRYHDRLYHLIRYLIA